MAASAPNPYANASLYIGDLAPDVTDMQLHEIFNAVGPVASVRVCRDAATRRSLGYAYVNFHRVQDADRAMTTMNFKNIRGKPCRIMWSHRDPSLRKSGVGNIFVSGLAPSIDNKTLYDTFSMFGNILSCKVATKGKKSLGYGFVHYESQEAAQRAIERANGRVIAEHQVTVEAFKAKPERPGTQFTNLYIKNIPLDYDEEKFRGLFSKFGDIQSLKLSDKPEPKSGKETKLTRYGFVDFKKSEDAQKALKEMNDFKVSSDEEARPLFVARAQKKSERERQLRKKYEQERAERQKQYRGVNLFVKNLADSVDDARLNQEFSPHGMITSAKVMLDKKTGKSRGFGFVCYSSPEEATKAVSEMNERMLEGKPLYVALAQRREERRAQLEAQYNRKLQQGAPMGYAPGGPVFYPGGMQRAPVMYPQFPGPGRVMMAPRGQMMQGPRGVPGAVNYQLMPMQQQQQHAPPQQRGGRQGGKQGQQGRPGVQLNQNVRNPQQPGPMSQQAPSGQGQGAQEQPISTIIANAPDDQKKRILGERLFPLVAARQPEHAGKITGMLLEMDNAEVIHLLESSKSLEDNIAEALTVLNRDDDESDEESDEESEGDE